MATLEWGDTFDHVVKTTGDVWTVPGNTLGQKWTNQLGGTDPSIWYISEGYVSQRPGAPYGKSLRVGTASTARLLYKTLAAGYAATRCISLWWYSGAGTTVTGVGIVGFFDGTTEHVSVRLSAGSKLTVTRAGTVLATSANSISTATWYHIQFKATIGDAGDAPSGQYEVRINGSATNWIPDSGTGQDTRNGGTAGANGVYCGAGHISWIFDDFLVTNDFPGVVVGAYLQGALPGNYQDWTPNSGTNRACVVGEAASDETSTMVASTVSGDIDTYVMEALTAGGTPTIIGVQHVIRAAQDAGVQRNVRPVQRSSSTDYAGTSVPTGAGWAYIVEAVSVDPDTGVAYTKASLEAAEFGYENV
jgi:hypothetical protein